MSASELAMKIREVRARHPFPWREVVHYNRGIVQLFDAENKEVALFDITALAVSTTAAMSEAKAA